MLKRKLEPEYFPFFEYKRYSFSLGLEVSEGVWLSGHSASRYSPAEKTMVVTGDLVEQTRFAYTKIEAILKDAGLGLRDIVRSVDYVTTSAIDDYPQLAELRRELFGDNPPVTYTVPVRNLLRPTALIEIEVVANKEGSTLIELDPPIDALHRARARRVGDTLYISSQLPYKPGTDEIVAPGDLLAQTTQIYENTGQILKAAGLGWENVVKTNEYFPREALTAYKATGRVRKGYLQAPYPGAAGIIMPRLAHPDALMQVDFVASYQPKQVANPGWARYQKLTYSPGVKAGNLLYLSGQAALDPETERAVHAGDVVEQTRHTYAGILKVVEAAGLKPENVVKTIEYVTPDAIPRYRETAEVRKEFFTEPYPSATGVICEGLLRPEFLIEIDAWAVVS